MANEDQISRGLSNRRNPGSGPSLSDIASIGLGSISEIKTLAANARQRLDTLENAKRLVEKRANEEYERALQLWGDQPNVGKREAKQRAQQAANQRRRNELKAQQSKVDAALQQLEGFKQQAKVARDLYGSPAAMLSREALRSDSERRRRLEMSQLLAHAGPAELRSHAKLSAACGDRLLGAAVLQRLDSMDKDAREETGVSRNELAEVLVGQDHQELAGLLHEVDAAHRRGIVAAREAETGKVDGLAQTEEGLRHRQQQQGDPADGDDGEGSTDE